MKNRLFLITLLLIVASVFQMSIVFAAEPTVCCEKTNSGFYCQNVPANECATNSRQAPSSCNSVSFCKPGVCFDSKEGLCSQNTPQVTCNARGGVWSAEAPAQCSLGCCLLGNQAAFVSLPRCKKLSAELGLKTNYDSSITNEVQCVLRAKSSEKGACVYEFEFEKTCKLTTRSDCSSGVNNTGTQGQFYPGKLCSAEELGTKCGPTERTTCVLGKDGVYFVDSCGNPANIYDALKVNNDEYWSNIRDVSESCNPNSANALSKNCGNCNYLLGSFCRDASKTKTKPQDGEFICADLNCKGTSNGKSYKHGESWCVNQDTTKLNQGENSVGSRFYKHICVNGEELVEQCADFRQEECLESVVKIDSGEFSQAACRVNRWQDCTAQSNAQDCDNTDKRDCLWKAGIAIGNISNDQGGSCIPKNTPGTEFWQGDDAKIVCALGNAQCIVKFEKGLLGGEKCKENCDCLTPEWQKQRATLCSSLGDCGPKTNWLGQQGYKSGFNVTVK